MPESLSVLEGQTVERSYAAEKQAELMDRLDYKVEAVLDLQQRLEALPDGTDSATVNQSLDQAWDNVNLMVPPEAAQQYERLVAIQEQSAGLARRMDDFFTNEEYTTEQLRADRQRLNTLHGEEDAIYEDENVQFLLNIGKVIADLRDKNADLSALGRNRQPIVVEVNNHMAKKIQAADVAEMHFTPFEITLVLTASAYRRVADDFSDGFHIPGTPYSIVRNRKNFAETIHHESIHNFLDQAIGIRQYDGRRLAGLAKEYSQTHKEEDKREIELILAAYNPTSLLNQMHNEFLAELDHWERQPWNEERPKTPRLDPNKPKSFAFHSGRYSTAGNNAATIASTFESISLRVKDKDKRDKIFAVGQEFRKEFVQAVEHMRQALMTARKHGDEAAERLHALLFILPPSRYRHLERYLEYSHGTSQD